MFASVRLEKAAARQRLEHLADRGQRQAGLLGQVPGVIVSKAEIRPFPLSAEALGNARSNEAIEVRSEISAALTAIHFIEGQRVEKGAVLASGNSDMAA